MIALRHPLLLLVAIPLLICSWRVIESVRSASTTPTSGVCPAL